jgi:hypothetical protein
MDPGWPIKAKRKVSQQPVVEPKDAVPPKVFAGSLQRGDTAGPGFLAAHESLSSLLPPGLRVLLPMVDSQRPVTPLTSDYSRFIAWLKVPRFATGNPAPDWARRFGHPLGEKRRRVLDLLATLVELGGQPQDRQDDLFHAWWELENMEPSYSKFQLVPNAHDSHLLLPVGDVVCMSDSPLVARCLDRLQAASFSSTAGGWNQRSILSVLGYAVGLSGASVAQRRVALRACFVMPDELVPRAQREFWGVRASHRRVRAIERMISLFISLAEHRTSGSWTIACRDWHQDLEWIRLRGLEITQEPSMK